jgi:hypothetical protein
VRSLLMPTSLLGLARSNDCAQHSHLSAANRAIFIASLICVAVQHSKTENRGILRKCQTSTATSAEPGDLPFSLEAASQPLLSPPHPSLPAPFAKSAITTRTFVASSRHSSSVRPCNPSLSAEWSRMSGFCRFHRYNPALLNFLLQELVTLRQNDWQTT